MAKIDLRGITPILMKLFTDKMDITTAVESSFGDATVNTYPSEPQQIDVPCRISFSGGDRARDNNSEREGINLTPKIFCAPNVQVLAGDRLIVHRCYSNGVVYETFQGIAVLTGRPNQWESHQEIALDMSGDA